MKRIVILAILFFAGTAVAQTPPGQDEINALLQSVAAQRDAANNQAAQLSARVTVLTAENERLKKDAADCKKPEVKK